jgi:16S rRNA A1518/A1519 N6-dimethyltransferase RsmA/KsgA/DIM1 with predicted DNA glycosylase/AP lyase activity
MPEVDSAVFAIEPRSDAPPWLCDRAQGFAAFVKALFSHRRKMLRAALRHAAGAIGSPRCDEAAAQAAGRVGVALNRRVEEIDPAAIAAIWHSIAPHP